MKHVDSNGLRLLFFAGGLWLLVGCSSKDVPHAGDFEYIEKYHQTYDGKVVARVNGEPIFVEELRRYREKHEDQSPREALIAVIDREVLFQEAKDKLKGAYRSEGLARKRAMVRQLLRGEFIDRYSAKSSDFVKKQFTTKLSNWKERAKIKMYPRVFEESKQR